MSSAPTIYVSIASMDDEELQYTIASAFDNASDPSRVFVGVSLLFSKKQSLNNLERVAKRYQNLSFIYKKQKKDNFTTLGVGKNRYWATTMYNDQDYLLQIDAHSHLDVGWDNWLIEAFHEAAEDVGDDKLVLTCIPGRFRYKDGAPDFVDVVEHGNPRCPLFINDSLFADCVPKWADGFRNFLPRKYFPSVKANSAMLFGAKDFARNTGVYFDAFFYDEELIYSIDLYGRGFALVYPNRRDFPIYHLDMDAAIEGHTRSFFLEYVSAKHKKDKTRLSIPYYSFIDDPKNRDAVKKYEKYARIDVRKGYQRSTLGYIPDNYREN